MKHRQRLRKLSATEREVLEHQNVLRSLHSVSEKRCLGQEKNIFGQRAAKMLEQYVGKVSSILSKQLNLPLGLKILGQKRNVQCLPENTINLSLRLFSGEMLLRIPQAIIGEILQRQDTSAKEITEGVKGEMLLSGLVASTATLLQQRITIEKLSQDNEKDSKWGTEDLTLSFELRLEELSAGGELSLDQELAQRLRLYAARHCSRKKFKQVLRYGRGLARLAFSLSVPSFALLHTLAAGSRLTLVNETAGELYLDDSGPGTQRLRIPLQLRPLAEAGAFVVKRRVGDLQRICEGR